MAVNVYSRGLKFIRSQLSIVFVSERIWLKYLEQGTAPSFLRKGKSNISRKSEKKELNKNKNKVNFPIFLKTNSRYY